MRLFLFTFGNVSASDGKTGVFAIKLSVIPYELLKAEDIVIVDFDANIVKGKMLPSSDTKTHALLYKTWNDTEGITHTHSTHAVAWAQAGKDNPIYGTTHADHTHYDIPCDPVNSDETIKRDYEFQTGIQFFEILRSK